jgi:hypothetical protein
MGSVRRDMVRDFCGARGRMNGGKRQRSLSYGCSSLLLGYWYDSLTCEDALSLSVSSLGAIERVEEVRKTADGDGTETGVEVCLACEPNDSDGCRREDLLHARVRVGLS